MFTTIKMKKGFTLIELMTAITIFTIIMTISMGSIVNVFEANRKARSQRTVLNNLNLVVESMSREMRFGKKYHCDTDSNASGPYTSPQNCPGPNPGQLVSFLSSDNIQITYRLNNGVLEKQVGSDAYVAITSPEIIIDDLGFYTLGALPGDSLQSKVFIIIKSHVGTGRSLSELTLQTLVSQRSPDF